MIKFSFPQSPAKKKWAKFFLWEHLGAKYRFWRRGGLEKLEEDVQPLNAGTKVINLLYILLEILKGLFTNLQNFTVETTELETDDYQYTGLIKIMYALFRMCCRVNWVYDLYGSCHSSYDDRIYQTHSSCIFKTADHDCLSSLRNPTWPIVISIIANLLYVLSVDEYLYF